jgi:uncharacterized protein YecT (DUF1311 family)
MDCGRATTIVDKAICASESLRQADAVLSDFYFATLRNIEGARHQLLIASQRLWLAERDRDCRENVESCVTQSIAARQTAIAVCFADGSQTPAARAAAEVTSCPYYLHREMPGDAGDRAWSEGLSVPGGKARRGRAEGGRLL